MDQKEQHPDLVDNECEYCDGTGEAQESCCGNRLNDMGICTGCGEHTYACGDPCEECGGTGKIN